MPEHVAIVGSREGADLDQVEQFVRALWEKYPDTILISGGADGVDKTAERVWLELGGALESYRPVSFKDSWVVQVWELGPDYTSVYLCVDFPTFENFKSAAIARDTLIAEKADRIVAFMREGGSRGSNFTAEWGEESQPKYRRRYYAESAVAA